MLSELIQQTSLVIWDEAPMTHRHCFEALDRTMCDILSEHKAENANIPFSGKPIMLGGDFRQILPVVRKGSRSAIVNASITSSPLWQHATILKLRTNMRLSNPSLHGKEHAVMEQFSKWVLDIGDGALPAVTRGDESEPTWITISEDLLIHTDGDAVASLISEVYPNLLERYMDPTYLATRAIVCPNNLTADKINDYIVSMLPRHGVQCLSCDTISKLSERIPDFYMLYPTEFLNSINATNFLKRHDPLGLKCDTITSPRRLVTTFLTSNSYRV
jgi:hypothetical protein